MPGLEELTGRRYGPYPVLASPDRVVRFVEAVGEDPERWSSHAPPMFANAALFTAAPAFLEDPEVRPYTAALIHAEQVYSWNRPLALGEDVQVSGRVAGIRSRGPLNLVTFEVSAASSDGDWLGGSSVFVMSQRPAGDSEERAEPPFDSRPPFDPPTHQPGPGVTDFACGASRSDLARYAAASGDGNPIHLDHDSARAAGLGGTIVHGLLMASWIATAVGRHHPGPDPLRQMRVRFRNPLYPGVASLVSGVPTEGGGYDVELTAEGRLLVSGSVVVTA